MADEDTNPLHHSEQQEQTEQPQGLRGLANEIIRRERSKYNTPIGERDFDSEDRLIDRSDERSMEAVEEPKFRTTEDAYEHLQERKREAEEEKYAADEQYLDQTTDEHRTRVRATATLSSDDERGRHGAYQQKFQQLAAAAARQDAIEKRVAPQIAALNQSGQTAAAMMLAREVLAGREPIAQEAAEVQRLGGEWQKYTVGKQKAAGWMEMASVCPGIGIGDTEKRFKRYLLHVKRYPISDIERENRPQVVAQEYKEFQEHETEQYRAAARKKVAAEVPRSSRGPGSSTSSKDAREALKSRGKPDDALAYFALRRAERKYGI